MDQAENLRNMMRQEGPKKQAKIITITSGKGGVGKSNICLNLAIQLRKKGKKILLMDADFGLSNLEVLMGIRPKYNLADLMFADKEIEEIIATGPEGISFISGGSGVQELAQLDDRQICHLTNQLKILDQMFDIIFIDTGAGISSYILQFIYASQEVIVVTTPEPTSITDAYAILKIMSKQEAIFSGCKPVQIIVNKVHTREKGKELYERFEKVIKQFLKIPVAFLGSVPYDDTLRKAVMNQEPVTLQYPVASSSKSFAKIASFLLKDEENLDKSKGILHMFSNLIRKNPV